MKTVQGLQVSPHRFRAIVLCLLVTVCVGWLLGGCVPTGVHPFYRNSDLTYDTALLGVWKDKADGKQRWTFTAAESKSYNLNIQSEEQRALFVAHLFKLGNERFLDLYPAKSTLEQSLDKNAYRASLIPGHLFVRVRATEPALRMSCMSLDWLNQWLKKNSDAIDHVVTDERVVFTGSTEAMQAFIKQHLATPEAWNDMYDNGLAKVGAAPTSQ